MLNNYKNKEQTIPKAYTATEIDLLNEIESLKSQLHGARIWLGRWKSEAHQLKEVA